MGLFSGYKESLFSSPDLAIMELLTFPRMRTDTIRPGRAYGFPSVLGGIPWAHVSSPRSSESSGRHTRMKIKNYVGALRGVVLRELEKLHREARDE